MRKLLLAAEIILLTVFYTIPYTLLKDARGFELVLFWLAIIILISVLAFLGLEKER
ncbi:hypothetical protein ACSU1N_06440 [Thermogladius sp. 4427co]|uniref:hypothetical protein n=1 Tax=Thermogladius sp. 4427co TaxID=3450718 RepID=UPI003F7A46DD